MTEPVIVWSRDGERFDADELGELMDCYDDLEVGSVVSRGEREDHDPTDWIDGMDIANFILESLGERAHEAAGEFADDYPAKPSNEALDELDAFLDAWVTKHFTPRFWAVENITDYTITEADVTPPAVPTIERKE